MKKQPKAENPACDEQSTVEQQQQNPALTEMEQALTDENEILMPFFHFNLVTVCDVKLYFINSPGGDWYESLFASFSFYFDKAFIKIEVA